MSLGVTFRRAARSEFIEAAARYEAQRPGLGATFITEIERCVASAAEQPLAYPVVHNDTRRLTAKRFPFSVYFRLEARRIVVSTVGAVRWFGNPGADHTAICTSQEKQRSYAVLSQLVGKILRDHVTLTCESVDRMYLNPAYELYAHEHLYRTLTLVGILKGENAWRISHRRKSTGVPRHFSSKVAPNIAVASDAEK